MSIKNKIAISLGIATLGFTGAAMAEEDVSIEKFGEAHKSVVEVQQKYVPQIEQMENPEEKAQVQQEAQAEMVGAIEDSGITIEEYNWVVNNYSKDSELKEKVDSVL